MGCFQNPQNVVNWKSALACRIVISKYLYWPYMYQQCWQFWNFLFLKVYSLAFIESVFKFWHNPKLFSIHMRIFSHFFLCKKFSFDFVERLIFHTESLYCILTQCESHSQNFPKCLMWQTPSLHISMSTWFMDDPQCKKKFVNTLLHFCFNLSEGRTYIKTNWRKWN